MTDKPPVLRMQRRFNVSPERVFDAWLDPQVVKQWLFTSSASERNSTELDARVGGKWQITDRRGGRDYTANGEYLEIDRPHRLVFTFAMPEFSPNADTITVEVAADGAGAIMTFTQSGVDIAGELRALPPGAESGSEQGWRPMFAALAAALGARIELPAGAPPRAPSRMMVLYKVKPERVAENEASIAKVFAELAERRPAGLEYTAFKLADGVSFLHLSTDTADAGPALMQLASFQEFLAGFFDRCSDPAMPTPLVEIGSYRDR